MSDLIICNGAPKSGTHALVKAVQLLGCVTEHGHYPHEEKPKGKMVHIVRNPRNTLISWVRFTKPEVTQGYIIAAMKDYSGLPMFEQFVSYSGYGSDDEVLTVRFEDLVADSSTMRIMADWLGVKYLGDSFPRLLGLTRTWTGKLTQWKDYWSDDIESAWIDCKGKEVEALWSY